jgi:O-antigen ligase
MNAVSGLTGKYRTLLFGGLLLFSLSLALSKSATNVLMALIYLAVLFLVARDQPFRNAVLRNARQPLLLPLVLYLSAAVFGLLFTEHLVDGLGIVNKIMGLLLVYLMVSGLLDSLDTGETAYGNAEKLLLAFLIGIAALNVIAFMTYLGLVGHKKFVVPLAPLNVHHIWFSNLNAIGLYASAAFLLFSPRGRTTSGKALFSLSMVFAVLCILLSISRTAWFGTLLTALIMTYILLNNRKVFFIIAAAAATTCVLLYQLSPIVHDRINLIASDIVHFSSGETATSLGERFLMWKAAIMMFLSNPLIGVGTGDYVPTMNSYIASGKLPQDLAQFNQPHNMYLFALATNGLLGLSALLYIFYRSLKFALPLIRSDGREKLFAFLAAATTVHFMIAGLTDSFFNIQILRYTFAFVMGVCVRNSVKAEGEKV